jgi:hypothetical protein
MVALSLADAEVHLLATPRPVLFLDTCDVVNLLQVITTVHLVEFRAVNRLLDALGRNSQRCQLVGTYVTAIEYTQKTDAANPVYQKDRLNIKLPPDAVADWLNDLDQRIDKLHLIRHELHQPLAPATKYASLNLLADLRATADLLLDVCWELQRDQAAVDAALLRVFTRTRPSQRREVKDSLHLEHCLALARRLRQNGFAEEIVFASANKNDYGPAVGTQPHPELQADFVAIQMLYFESLSRGIAHLGI